MDEPVTTGAGYFLSSPDVTKLTETYMWDGFLDKTVFGQLGKGQLLVTKPFGKSGMVTLKYIEKVVDGSEITFDSKFDVLLDIDISGTPKITRETYIKKQRDNAGLARNLNTIGSNGLYAGILVGNLAKHVLKTASKVGEGKRIDIYHTGIEGLVRGIFLGNPIDKLTKSSDMKEFLRVNSPWAKYFPSDVTKSFYDPNSLSHYKNR